jgi:hypothetical protein
MDVDQPFYYKKKKIKTQKLNNCKGFQLLKVKGGGGAISKNHQFFKLVFNV